MAIGGFKASSINSMLNITGEHPLSIRIALPIE